MNKISLYSFVLSATIPLSLSAAQKEKPNVLFIVVDDLGWTDMQFMGSDLHQTPHVTSLANDGVYFTNGYSACTVSSPSRAALVTAKYPARLHVTDWIEGYNFPDKLLQIPDWTKYLAPEENSIGKIFKSNGYITAHFGKWHLGEDEKYWPENQGFDSNMGGWAKGSPNNSNGGKGYFSPYRNPRLEDGPEGEYLTERFAEEICSFIDTNKDKPFFVNFWLYNVHTRLDAKKEKIDKYKKLVKKDAKHQNPTYAAMVEHVDDAVGTIINKLKEEGLYENTIIIFTSDNGGLIGKKNKITNNAPLRDGKGTIYEGGVRVPVVIKQAGEHLCFKDSTNRVISMDFLPTLVDLASLKVSAVTKKSWDGVSLGKILNKDNSKLKREAIYFHYPHYHTEGAAPYTSIVEGAWKLIHLLEYDQYELYNLDMDLGETTNLSDKYPAKKNELIQKIERWKKSVGAQMPTRKDSM